MVVVNELGTLPSLEAIFAACSQVSGEYCSKLFFGFEGSFAIQQGILYQAGPAGKRRGLLWQAFRQRIEGENGSPGSSEEELFIFSREFCKARIDSNVSIHESAAYKLFQKVPCKQHLMPGCSLSLLNIEIKRCFLIRSDVMPESQGAHAIAA